jgi:steroid delta-isomerase-like uncharacterized protein
VSRTIDAVLDDYTRVWNEGKLALVDEIIAADCVMHSALRGDERGPAALKASYQRYITAFPDMRFKVLHSAVADDTVMRDWAFEGTHKGEWFGVAATGKRVSFAGTTAFRIAGGRILEMSSLWDAPYFLQQVGRSPTAAAANKAVAERWLNEIWIGGKLALVDELVAPDYVHHSTPEDESRGREAVRQGYRNWNAAFSDMRRTVLETVAEGDKVMHFMRIEGTHRGEWNGVDVTGKKVSYTGIVTFRIADGRVAETWTHWNTVGWLKQVGRKIT